MAQSHEQSHEAGARSDSAHAQGSDQQQEETPLHKRPMVWIAGAGTLALLLVGAFIWWLDARHYEDTDDAFVDAHIVRLAAQTTGRLTAIYAIDNRHVRKGELLASIEPETPAATFQEAKSNVAQADAAIEQARAKVFAAVVPRHRLWHRFEVVN